MSDHDRISADCGAGLLAFLGDNGILSRVPSEYIVAAMDGLPQSPPLDAAPTPVEIDVPPPWPFGRVRIWCKVHKPPRRKERPFWRAVRAEQIEQPGDPVPPPARRPAGLMVSRPAPTDRACWTCRYCDGRYPSGGALCVRQPPASGHWHIALPATGCAFWEREPGADDEVRNSA